MNRASHRNIFIILSTIAFFLLVFYVGGFWVVRNTTKKTSQTEYEIAKIQRQEEVGGSIQKLLDETVSERETLRNFFVGDIVSFLENIENLAKETGVTLTIRNVSEESDAGGLNGKLIVTMSFAGTWDSVFRLLSLIEATPQGVFIKQATLSHQRSGQSSPSSESDEPYLPWDANITIGVWKK